MVRSLFGLGGILAIQGINEITPPEANTVGIIIQIILGIVSIWKMVKKPKTQEQEEPKKKINYGKSKLHKYGQIR